MRVTKGYLGCSTQSDYPGLLNLEGEGWGNEICFGGIQHKNLDPTTILEQFLILFRLWGPALKTELCGPEKLRNKLIFS